MNDGSYRAVSTITREQAPKEAHLNTVGIPASFSGKKGFIVKSEFLVAIIFVEMKKRRNWNIIGTKPSLEKKLCVRSDKMLSCPEAGGTNLPNDHNFCVIKTFNTLCLKVSDTEIRSV